MSVESIGTGNTAAALTNLEPQQVLPQQKTQAIPSVDRTDNQVVREAELTESLEQIQVMMDLRNRAVEFTTDEVSGTQVVKVVDANSGDVIRQMPAEELLSFMRNLTRMLGTFIDKST